jgi:hypothetical protein
LSSSCRRCARAAFACPLTLRPDWQFDAALGERKLLEHLGAASLQAWNAEDLPLPTPPPPRCCTTPSTPRAAP